MCQKQKVSAGKSLHRCGKTGRTFAALGTMVVLLSYLCTETLAGQSGGGETGREQKNSYAVFFVDGEDYTKKIFNTQYGRIREEEALEVSFPEQIVGDDNYIWKAKERSPQRLTLSGAGTHKIYIEYEQTQKLAQTDPGKAGEEKLDRWIQKAWEAECSFTGNDPSGAQGYRLVEDEASNNERIKNLSSMIQDGEWHYFHLIGKNYKPRTIILGMMPDLEYSSVEEESFNVGSDRYHVLQAGVRRNWREEDCIHDWVMLSSIPDTCLINGQEICRCIKCGLEETSILPARGHEDQDQDSLCDRCKKRAFAQKAGDSIKTVLMTESGPKMLTFTCLDEDYRGSGRMMYLSDEVLTQEITGPCFGEGEDYNQSPIRNYFSFGFANESSLSGALSPIEREDSGGLLDFASLLSLEEYRVYQEKGGLRDVKQGYYLRTPALSQDGSGNVMAVLPGGEVQSVPADSSTIYGARPFVLLNKPVTGEEPERLYWREGDVQARKLGEKLYLFRCVDEDYSDAKDSPLKGALFLCDSVIRSDVDRDKGDESLKKLTFGRDNNYKASAIRRWLENNATDARFGLSYVLVGVDSAYTGATEDGAFEQMTDNRLRKYDIGFQLIQERLFCLSVEEALKHRDVLWKFGGKARNNPKTQLSPYSQGYYLRTPFYFAGEDKKFQYSGKVYGVDLVSGNIHAVDTDSETYGIRPAFVLPQR